MGWIQRIDNPNEIPWVFALYGGYYEYLEKKFSSLEKALGVSNFQEVIKEISEEGGSSVSHVYNKIRLMEGEICCFQELRRGFNVKNYEIKK